MLSSKAGVAWCVRANATQVASASVPSGWSDAGGRRQLETLFVSGSPAPESLLGVMVMSCESPSQGTVTAAEPDGPKPAGVKLSTVMSTAVAFSVAQVT